MNSDHDGLLMLDEKFMVVFLCRTEVKEAANFHRDRRYDLIECSRARREW